MEIKGYKAFHKDMTNHYNIPFREGIIYSVEGPLQYGSYERGGNGFHFCERLEDTLRYYPAKEEEVVIAEVTSLGEVVRGFDEFYEFDDMYAARSLRVDTVLSREEIIERMLQIPVDHRVIRFLQYVKLTPEELQRFKETFKDRIHIMHALAYYQEGDTEVYERYERSKNPQMIKS